MLDAVSLRSPKYRHHKAKNLAVVTIRGRDIYLGKCGSPESHQEYRRLVAEYIQACTVSRLGETPTISVIEIIAAYLQFANGYYRKAGKVTREYELIVECCRFIKPLYARRPAAEFGPLALKVVRQKMIEADHSRKYINKNMERIRRMFKWAAENEMIPASIPQALSMVAGLRQGRCEARDIPPVLPVDDSTVSQTLPHAPEVVADMIRLQRSTGMRPHEVCLLRPIDLVRTGDVWTYRPESHKTQRRKMAAARHRRSDTDLHLRQPTLPLEPMESIANKKPGMSHRGRNISLRNRGINAFDVSLQRVFQFTHVDTQTK